MSKTVEKEVQKTKQEESPKFALIGLGFISESHIEAIEAVGGKIVLACDVDTNTFFKVPECTMVFNFWTEMMTHPLFKEVDYVSICTPNYLHLPIINSARALGKKVICEKPLVLNCTDVLTLDNDVNTVLQLRYSPFLLQMSSMVKETNEVTMDICVHRGEWYFDSWKNDVDLSGGMCMNIGVHYFDLLTLLFGELNAQESDWLVPERKAVGVLTNDNTFISWKLSLLEPKATERRQININGHTFLLNRGFGNLHTRVYEDVLAGNGIKPKAVFDSIKLVNKVNKRLGEVPYEASRSVKEDRRVL